MRCQYCEERIYSLGNGEYGDEYGFRICPARAGYEHHEPLLKVVE